MKRLFCEQRVLILLRASIFLHQATGFYSLHEGGPGGPLHGADLPLRHPCPGGRADRLPVRALPDCAAVPRGQMARHQRGRAVALLLCFNCW